MAFLTSLLSRRQFPLAQFDLAPLAFELGRSCEGEQAGNSVPQPHPITPGEMRESIERHLRLIKREDDSPLLEQDAVDELREAIAELRRSIG
jgi:hypothetical protein